MQLWLFVRAIVLTLLWTVPVQSQNQNELAAIADRDIWFLGPETFEERTKAGLWLIYFGTTWCPYCKNLTPKWLNVQKMVEKERLSEQMFGMAKVDCTNTGDFCAKLQVTGYPNIFLFVDGQFVEQYYSGHEESLLMAYIRIKLRWYQSVHPTDMPVVAAQNDPPKLAPANVINDQKLVRQERDGSHQPDEAVVSPSPSPTPSSSPVVGPKANPSPPPIAKAPAIPKENQPIPKNKPLAEAKDQDESAGTLKDKQRQEQDAASSPVNEKKDLAENMDDGMTNTTVKGTNKHPIKEFRGFRGFLQTRLVTPLVGAECSTSLLQFKFFSHFDCTRLLISKVLGIGLVAGGAVIKMPQIYKIFMKRSAIGVSFASYALETAAYIAGLAYNVRQGNPFNTYGEHAFMAIANCVVIAMMFHYTNRHNDLITVGIATFVFTFSLFSRFIINDTILLSFQWIAILIGIVSKLPQIYSNWENKSCGQLSAVTVGLQTVGSLARCFTTATEVKDLVIFVTYLVATCLNGTVLYQVYLYWGKSRKSKSLMD